MSTQKSWTVSVIQTYIKEGYAAGYPGAKEYYVEGPAPFGGTIYVNEKQANAVVDELNRLHAHALSAGSTTTFTPR